MHDAIVAKVKRGLSIYNKATAPQTENLLSAFKTAFYERFEDEEVMLSKALDVEVGIGYKQNQHSLDINPLIDDIAFPAGPTNQASDIKWNRVNSIFHKKLVDAFVDSSYTITLSDTDFENFEENWDDLPYTLSTIIEIVNIDGKQKILLGSAGGSSGANLLGRFCHGDELMNNHANTIAKFESGYRNDKLFAEIVHLPESRVGNILTRPAFREFEIPYLAKSNLAFDKQLTIDDLRLSVKNNKVVLRSEKYDKEVIPRLTNAHNFHSNSLPIYHFLADLQTQGKRAYIGIQPGPLTEQYKFLPRVEYEDLIFCEAMWNFSSEDLKPLYTIENDLKLLEEIGLLRKKYKLPKFVSIADGDNELLINLENLTSLKMFLNTVKNRSSVKLKEFLHNEDGVVKHKGNSETFTNQFILSFFNTKN